MLSDWELWACANQARDQHGNQAPAYVAERIGACAVTGDIAGIVTWKAIADPLQPADRSFRWLACIGRERW